MLTCCQKLASNWPDLWGEVEAELPETARSKKVRGNNKKRKIAAEDHGRVPVTKFKSESDNLASPSSAAETSSASLSDGQKTLSQAWTSSTGDPTKLTAARQTRIDYFLLRFIIGCSIAFAILDNGFFWDFITCL